MQTPPTTDPYLDLGVARSATADEIKRAYWLLAKETHPDQYPGDKAREARFKRVAAAYEVLGDAERRATYDRTTPPPPPRDASATPPPKTPPRTPPPWTPPPWTPPPAWSSPAWTQAAAPPISGWAWLAFAVMGVAAIAGAHGNRNRNRWDARANGGGGRMDSACPRRRRPCKCAVRSVTTRTWRSGRGR